MNTSELYELFIHHPLITTDSRHCSKGSVFFALKGERFDGNQYAQQALAKGSIYAVIDNPDYYIGERTILVEDTLKTLQELAVKHRKALGIPVIGITGTNGKTTTKELLASVLSTKFNLLYTEGNLNNHIGVPLTLLRLTHEHELAVIEMGASRPGDIKELAEIVQPNFGIITNVGEGHLEGFGSYEGVFATKTELYQYIKRTKGILFINEENKELLNAAKGIEQYTYGYHDTAFTSGQIVESNPFLVFNWKQQGKINQVETQLIGSYNLDNLLVAVTVGRYFKIPSGRINRALEAYAPTNNRSQLKKTSRNTLIIDTYNANPTSMQAALENFALLKTSPKAIILGDMGELGSKSEALHTRIVEKIKSCPLDKVYLCGENFSKVASGLPTFKTTDELKEELKRNPLTGYHILIKGSHYMALDTITGLL
ncbi:MAG: UDP-N-acetylmuramoyl-tripeptide--D-alanyl-D-alanine ligase [Tannerellaceae bacterium]|nr:UDP-N-acetylmuramoyl-tripeptide--D-alanyl-D-alanine ligase [Tannerellaceae bacterium]MCD8263811.1 UDP-N-acetylmuramoyl-tripeptide--D-alanyl-D-alanine ligase [Tannerellaceae bacterium]